MLALLDPRCLSALTIAAGMTKIIEVLQPLPARPQHGREL